MSEKTHDIEVNRELLAAITRQMHKHPDIILTDENPDIVHLFGAWEKEVSSFANQLYKKTIPYVYSPLGGLLPWNVKQHQYHSSQKKLTARASAVHVCSALEKEQINERQWNKEVIVIKNAVITNDIEETAMVEDFIKLYTDIIASYNFKTHEDIQSKVSNLEEEDENIRFVFGKILFAYHYIHRGNLSQNDLDDLSQTMTAVEYDEDKMAELLRKHHLDQFTARLEQVMMDISTLTEGFTTLPPIQDKTTEKMKASITHYEQPTITTD
jgi:hypothetical protein